VNGSGAALLIERYFYQFKICDH